MAEQRWTDVADAIADRIRAGQWPVGTRIPTATILGREYGVAPRTARKAVDHLAAHGILAVRVGAGSFVAVIPVGPVPGPDAPRPDVAVLRAQVEDLAARLTAVEERLARVDGGPGRRDGTGN